MVYSTNNVTLSLHKHFSELLRENGYNVFWHAWKDLEPHTSGLPEAKGTITLVPEFPANPSYLVRLTDGNPAQDKHLIGVPAFSVQVIGSPRKIRRQGLGDPVFERERRFRIDGFCTDAFQHRELADLFYSWLEGTDKRLEMWDFETDGSNPPQLEPVYIQFAEVDREELIGENEAIRYYVHLQAAFRYFE